MVASSERLQRPPERKPAWIGKDFELANLFRARPGKLVEADVVLPSDNFPDDFSHIQVSTSSRYAHLGLEVVSEGWQLLDGFSFDGQVRTRLQFKNNGERTAVIYPGKQVGRPYVKGEALEGEELKALLKDNVHIDGKETSWEAISILGRPVGVRLHLDPESVKQILPGEAIVLNGETNYREIIDQFTGPIEPSWANSFWFAETYAHVQIAPGIVGILQDPFGPGVEAHMLNAPLIYGGQTDWPIRAEFVSPTMGAEMPTYIDMVFQKVAE